MLQPSFCRTRFQCSPVQTELAKDGVRSSIWASNAQLLGSMTAACGTMTDLLFDPQTAGGLLAAVPPQEADAVLESLIRVGRIPRTHRGDPPGEALDRSQLIRRQVKPTAEAMCPAIEASRSGAVSGSPTVIAGSFGLRSRCFL